MHLIHFCSKPSGAYLITHFYLVDSIFEHLITEIAQFLRSSLKEIKYRALFYWSVNATSSSYSHIEAILFSFRPGNSFQATSSCLGVRYTGYLH